MVTKSKISLAFIAFMYVYIVFNGSYWEDRNTIDWDPGGYYVYLPATFIYNDVGKLGFYPQLTSSYYINRGEKTYWLFEQPEGMKLDKYPMGVSLLELPFFLAAHWYCSANPKGPHPADGYSHPYMESIILAGVFWVLTGLFVLRRFLLRYVSDNATAATLLLIAFGTNLHFYTVFSTGMSHPFSFALFCFLLSATDKWYRTGRMITAIPIGLIMGLIVITRPSNIIVAMIPLCWTYKGRVSDRFAFFKEQLVGIIAATIVFFDVLMILLIYWKYVTGDWMHFAYHDESFNFCSPEIWRGLFSYRKGWFVYTPVAFISVLGLILLAKKHKRLAAIISIYLAINIYIVFSWVHWWYGGGFGARALVESMAILALPLAMLMEWVFAKKKLALNILALAICFILITLNAFQSYQLTNNITEWDKTNKAFYWRSFGKLKVTEEDRKLLNQ